MTMPVHPLRDIAYVAGVLGISVPTLYRWVSEKRGPKPLRVGRLLRWTDDSIAAYIADAEAKGRA